MTEKDKEKIVKLRKQGSGYLAIANALGLSRDCVRKFCKRHSLDGIAETAKLNFEEKTQQGSICRRCGNEIKQPERGRPKSFCSDKCRSAWWTENYGSHNFGQTAMHKIICANCGKEFVSYSNKNRKFCSHDCYIKSRFGGKEND